MAPHLAPNEWMIGQEQQHARAARARAEAAERTAAMAAAEAGAQIIDISGRIGDQVYDQYSDAANRAVGD
jgi:sarcosine oxidase gamma subunit